MSTFGDMILNWHRTIASRKILLHKEDVGFNIVFSFHPAEINLSDCKVYFNARGKHDRRFRQQGYCEVNAKTGRCIFPITHPIKVEMDGELTVERGKEKLSQSFEIKLWEDHYN